MRTVLEACRGLFGPAPRHFPEAETRRYLRVSPPGWLRRKKQHPLWEQYRQAARLFQEGEIVWGYLVRQYALPFQKGTPDFAAMAVYVMDPSFDDQLDGLGLLARQIYDLKGTRPDDPEERRLAEMLDDVDACELNPPLPASISGEFPCRSSLMMVHRKHLPNGELVQRAVPLLILPAVTQAAVILPSRYWPPALQYAWRGQE